MPAWLTLLLLFALYVILTKWLLPKLGVPT